MAEIHYVTGDATEPVGDGPKTIAHICNDQGGWGRGFVLALSAKWWAPEDSYRQWYRPENDFQRELCGPFGLGRVQWVYVDKNIMVANMVAQRGIRNPGDPCAVDYVALRACLDELGSLISMIPGASVHMPRIGIGLGGGSWDAIEPIILETLIAQGVETYVYDLEARHA